MADTSPIVVYFAHPVGAPDAAGVEANLQRARQWLRWLIDLPNPAVQRIAWCVPWWAYVDTLGDGANHYRQRGLRDTLAAAARCDALVATGKLTPGVTIELAQAERQGQPVVNLIALGALPPSTGETNWWTSRPAAGVIAELVELVSGSMLRAAAKNAERNYFRLEWIVPVLTDPAVQMALSGKRFTPEERERLMREHFAKHAGGELERFDRQLAAMGEVLDG